jgi:TonB family protein
MIRISAVAFLAVCTMFSSVQCDCQNAASPLPQDPLALMTLAHEKNGLIGADVKPWHMHGTYHSYKDGKLDYEGTYEEWWISPTKYKISFINPKQVQTDYATGDALLRDGTQEWLSGPELLLRGSFAEPLPDPAQLKDFTLVRSEQKVGKGKIECVSFTYPVRNNLQVRGDYFPAACFEPSMPVLRVLGNGRKHIVFDNLAEFQGHYIAKKIVATLNGKPEADLELDVVESLKQTSEAVLSPPPSAKPVDLSTIVINESGTQWPAALKKAVPEYPQQAKSLRIQGTVTIKAMIGADGHVENPTVVGGPTELRSASLDAVRQWIYRPFEVMGQPRPVAIEIHEIFSFN